jgi:6-phosphogluconolactonase
MAMLTIAGDAADLDRTAAGRITSIVESAVHAHGAAMVSLTGGQTPRRLYEMLADPHQPWRARIPWGRVHLFWSDERHVPPDHPDSNFRMADDALVAKVPIPSEQVHRILGELQAEEAARAYELELGDAFRAAGRTDQTFDLMLLGLGEDAHIASIFPGSPVLDERTRRVAAPWVSHLHAYRITLTPPALLDARRIVMLVEGPKKAEAVAAALEGPPDVARWPAQLLRAAGDRVEWLIDRSAAQGLRAQRA